MNSNEKKDPLESMPLEQWSELGENLEPDWDSAHKPKMKTKILTVRLGPADMDYLKAEAARLGIGHSTLARMILRQALRESRSTIEEAAVTSDREVPVTRETSPKYR